ncbi:MAG: hypothetical protein KDD29_00805 [Flavobacteriales bacterium]|nr:hypothetical protein [Flavobacteriales bacterium]MCB9336015.1 hypothetical protein [Flavobacteriales bacterium]
MGKSVLAVLLGLLASFVVVAAIEYLGHALYPLSEQIDVNETEALKKLMENAPFGALFMVLIAHLFGGAASVFTTIKIAKKSGPAYVVAILFFLLTISNLFMIPHPIWFTVSDVVMVLAGFVLVFKFVKPVKE